jgi:hypothetical protein
MRIVFHWNARKKKRCPACGARCNSRDGFDRKCPRCGLIFHRTVQIEGIPDIPSSETTNPRVRHVSLAISHDGGSALVPTAPVPPNTAFDEYEDVRCYRRVCILERQRRIAWESLTPCIESSKTRLEESTIDQAPPESNETTAFDAEHQCFVADIAPQGLDDDGFDIGTFEQILEMDDEDAEHEFSRIIMLGCLEQLEEDSNKVKSPM